MGLRQRYSRKKRKKYMDGLQNNLEDRLADGRLFNGLACFTLHIFYMIQPHWSHIMRKISTRVV